MRTVFGVENADEVATPIAADIHKGIHLPDPCVRFELVGTSLEEEGIPPGHADHQYSTKSSDPECTKNDNRLPTASLSADPVDVRVVITDKTARGFFVDGDVITGVPMWHAILMCLNLGSYVKGGTASAIDPSDVGSMPADDEYGDDGREDGGDNERENDGEDDGNQQGGPSNGHAGGYNSTGIHGHAYQYGGTEYTTSVLSKTLLAINDQRIRGGSVPWFADKVRMFLPRMRIVN